VLGLAAAFIALSGCSGSSGPSSASSTPKGSGAFTPANAPIATPNLQLVAALEPFSACNDLLGYVKDAALERVGPYGLSATSPYYQRGVAEDRSGRPGEALPAPTVPATTSAPSNSTEKRASGETDQASGGATATTTQEHSETNVQEKGVDEPDTIKTDGNRILAMTGNRLIEVNVEGAAPQNVGSITLPGNGTSQLLLAGNHVLAINANPVDVPYVEDDVRTDVYQPPTESTLLSLVDIADPSNMKILHTVRIDGTFVSARMVDGQARVVTTSTPARMPFVNASNATTAAIEAATKANKAIIQDSKLEDWLPLVHIGNGSTPTDKPLLDCAKVSHPKTFSGFSTLAVVSVDVGANEVNPADAVGVMADGQTVYASKTGLYVATPAYVEAPRPAPTGTGPTTIPPAPIPLRNNTAIHKYDIAAKGAAVYRASGEVEGTLLSQFSMSEDEGFLRVATTTSPNNCGRCPGAESFVRVLQESDGELKQVGQVGNMGRGEQIKAVRFIGKQGYVVTFRQTDPLYTIDLSTPTTPRVVGDLKILGYSAYLHPAGDGLLIGIGQDATATGRTLGTKVALFDVSDLANPREIQQYVLFNSTSQAEQDFHAFTYWEPTKLAVIPVDRAYLGFPGGCPNPGPTGGVCAPDVYPAPFTGAIGLTIDRNGISELGRIVNPGGYFPPDCTRDGTCVPSPCPPDAKCSGVVPTNGTIVGGARQTIDCTVNPCTSSTPTRPGPVPTTAVSPVPPCPVPLGSAEATQGWCPPYGVTGSRIERSIVITDTLFTFSANGLKTSDLTTLLEEHWLPFF
jgi:uncharacterized secreted protein with C-terminal beta-propeller domain